MVEIGVVSVLRQERMAWPQIDLKEGHEASQDEMGDEDVGGDRTINDDGG